MVDHQLGGTDLLEVVRDLFLLWGKNVGWPMAMTNKTIKLQHGDGEIPA